MPILGSSASQSGKLSGVPTIGTAIETSGTTATVTFTAPAHVGKGGAVTYTATSSPGGITGTSSSSPITVSGLTTGTSYTFTVTATNSNGTSTASSSSNSVTPVARILYTYGGYNGGYYSSMFKFNTENDARSTLAATLDAGAFGHNEMSNWGSASYICGGGTNFNVVAYSTIQKLLFSNDARSNLSATLSTGRGLGSSMTNSGTKGYMSNGQNSSGNSLSSTETVIYSNETRSTIASTVSAGSVQTGLSNSGTAGYSDQFNGSANSSLFKLTYSNETFSSLGDQIGRSGQRASASNSGTAGYFTSGTTTGSNVISIITKITFSNDTGAIIGATFLDTRGYGGTGCGVTGLAGYFTPGTQGPTAYSTMQKLFFSNDTRSTTTNAALDNQAWMGSTTSAGA